MPGLGLDIDIRHNIKEFTKYLDGTERKQIPYAISLAINGTAFDVRDALVKHTKAHFRNRRAWYRPKSPVGIHVQKSHKKKRLVATVSTAWAPAQKHEEGGVRRPHRGKNLLIPTDRVPKSRRGAGGAGGYLAQNKIFSTPRGIFRRVGGKRNAAVQLLYWKVHRAAIKPRYGWGEVAVHTVTRRINPQFQRALAKALRTAR
jgi:hypothetical protein